MPFLLPIQQHQSTEGKSVLIMGDFNYAGINWSSFTMDDLGQIFEVSFGLFLEHLT